MMFLYALIRGIEAAALGFDAADQYWKGILAESSGNPAVIEVELVADVSPTLLNVTSFLAWYFLYAAQASPSRLLTPRNQDQGNPQQWFQNDTESDGYVARQTFMPVFASGTQSSPVQLTLHDGTVFTWAVTAASAESSSRGQGGVNLHDYFYVPSATPASAREEIRRHLAVQLGNSLKFAYEDIAAGALSRFFLKAVWSIPELESLSAYPHL
ncbi:hypothetical protein B0T26DRAFT_681681 [Lasiosphaeria miniovina]|uniref:Uncharacterized protein n=1 Tax=Lasiosphaeria miniovina TaxID=1954250 RepID=A0AA40DI55_9PEZI|nr:uncharacterized protein B0T26DRAFT_681681 [Lasiosphaeria miniovina]KAK0704075.1 hypothetical protein B0T26DRAFT_681681 [Lasiosphaeria miniovina]